MADSKDAVVELLPKFLENPRMSEDGGYAPVSDEDLDDLGRLFRLIVSTKFERDAVGDLPVEIVVVNRHKYESPEFVRVPYHHKAGWKAYFRAAFANMRIASRKLGTAFSLEPKVPEAKSWEEAGKGMF